MSPVIFVDQLSKLSSSRVEALFCAEFSSLICVFLFAGYVNQLKVFPESGCKVPKMSNGLIIED